MSRFVPTIISCVGFVFATLACVAAYAGILPASYAFALLAFVADIADGAVARALQAESRLGRIWDTAVDIMLYLLYPSILVLSLTGEAPLIVVALTIFVGAGLLRLHRFFQEGFIEQKGRIGYSGVPVFFSLLLVGFYLSVGAPEWLVVLACFVLAPLMVSRIYVPKLRHIPSVIGIALFAFCVSMVIFVYEGANLYR
jgi:phosphatidylserine synthase